MSRFCSVITIFFPKELGFLRKWQIGAENVQDEPVTSYHHAEHRNLSKTTRDVSKRFKGQLEEVPIAKQCDNFIIHKDNNYSGLTHFKYT